MAFKRVELFGGAMTMNVPEEFDDVSLLRPVPSHQEIYLCRTGLTSLILEITQRVDVDETSTSSSSTITTAAAAAAMARLRPAHEQPSLAADRAALLFHFEDVISEGDEGRVWEVEEGVVGEEEGFPPQTPLLTLLATTTTPSPQPQQHTTALLVSLIRLPAHTTDLLITVNVPLHQGQPQHQQQGTLPPNQQLPNGNHEPGHDIMMGSALDTQGNVVREEGIEEDGEQINFGEGRYGRLVREGARVREEAVRSLRVGDWGLFAGEEE